MTIPGAWQRLCESIEANWPVSRFRDVGVVVGCSGGADSVALLRALVELVGRDSDALPARGFIVAAHFNHRFRGDASDADADFVRQLAGQLGVQFEIHTGDSDARDEQSARRDRREFFRKTLRRSGARYLALAHSLDDNVETILYRLMRGTGPAGLSGIAPFRPLSDRADASDFVTARPMLDLGRSTIRDALIEQRFPWRDDESNGSNEYRRNWIRNKLIPLIQTQYPDAVDAIGRAIDGQRQWQRALQPSVDRWLEAIQITDDPLVLRRLDGIQSFGEALRGGRESCDQAISTEALRQCWHRLGWPLRAMGQSHWQRLFALLCGDGPDAITLPGAILARRDGQTVTIDREA
ncbi:MAG: tRNA lysidine(34) synthetase TilS [Planctomycetales bacterium]|nr:tRNA lysidine(34) synthetase TilS [Planctomycetales bacterium]